MLKSELLHWVAQKHAAEKYYYNKHFHKVQTFPGFTQK